MTTTANPRSKKPSITIDRFKIDFRIDDPRIVEIIEPCGPEPVWDGYPFLTWTDIDVEDRWSVIVYFLRETNRFTRALEMAGLYKEKSLAEPTLVRAVELIEKRWADAEEARRRERSFDLDYTSEVDFDGGNRRFHVINRTRSHLASLHPVQTDREVLITPSNAFPVGTMWRSGNAAQPGAMATHVVVRTTIRWNPEAVRQYDFPFEAVYDLAPL